MYSSCFLFIQVSNLIYYVVLWPLCTLLQLYNFLNYSKSNDRGNWEIVGLSIQVSSYNNQSKTVYLKLGKSCKTLTKRKSFSISHEPHHQFYNFDTFFHPHRSRVWTVWVLKQDSMCCRHARTIAGIVGRVRPVGLQSSIARLPAPTH